MPSRPSRSRAKAAPSAAAAAVVCVNDETAAAAAPAPPPIIAHLPLTPERIAEIVRGGPLAAVSEPIPYSPFDSGGAPVGGGQNVCESTVAPLDAVPTPACFWCCHAPVGNTYGMPVAYDAVRAVFHVYGSFCSLQCAAAHNFAMHLGSDRAWDVHAWIQMLARALGSAVPVRPAPSRYALQMFGGPLSIDEFRRVHATPARSVTYTVPPTVTVQASIETMNTSFFTHAALVAQARSEAASAAPPDGNDGAGAEAKPKLARRKAVVDASRSLESKMNLCVAPVAPI